MEASLHRLFSAENGGGAESSSFLSWFDLSDDQSLSRNPPRITRLEQKYSCCPINSKGFESFVLDTLIS